MGATSAPSSEHILLSREDNKKERNPQQQQQGPQPQEQPWKIPTGAKQIVENMAAQRIFELTLNGQGASDRRNDCGTNSSLDMCAVEDLVTRFPAVCHQRYHVARWMKQGQSAFALSILLCFKPRLHLIEKVYNANPSAVCVEGRNGWLPFHVACAMNAPLSVVRFLYSRYPEAVRTPTKDKRCFPLHTVLSRYTNGVYRVNSDLVIDFLLQKYPEAASKKIRSSHYPMHLAVIKNVPVHIVQRLFDLCPETASAADKKGWTPLHHACRAHKKGKAHRYYTSSSNNLHVLDFLLQTSDPDALSRRTRTQWTPLTFAAAFQTPHGLAILLDHLEAAIERCPTLLHYAARDNSADTVHLLARRYPWMLITPAPNGAATPLHSACRRLQANSSSVSSGATRVIRALLCHNRGALLMPDTRGRLPLQVATEAASVMTSQEGEDSTAAVCNTTAALKLLTKATFQEEFRERCELFA